MSSYQQGKNWTASGGSFYNGHGQAIEKPSAYFASVAANHSGYNSSYSNGHGQAIDKPSAYYAAVGTLTLPLVVALVATGQLRWAARLVACLLPLSSVLNVARNCIAPPAASDKYGYSSKPASSTRK
jgi:hypothetical protein